MRGKLRAAHSFLASRQEQDLSAWLHDMRGGSDAFHGLVKRQVERIAGGGGNHGVDRLVEQFQHDARDKVDALPVRGHGLARKHLGDRSSRSAAAERDIHQKIMAREARNLQ